ncbi:M50 family peptidase [Candidatus Parcubacteria bacterium]|jgi:membrane-associated protease RseP (regulator of RpoE activity)|nr:MAG: M50 family peptidase [Candidatus Parcubacteria bacterium]
MALILFILGSILIIMTHEMCHIVAMKKYGIEIARLCLGLFPTRFSSINFPASWLGKQSQITLSFWFLGAIVEPSAMGAATLKALAYKERSVIYGAGILGNIILGLVIAGLWHICFGHQPFLGFLLWACALGFYLARRLICRYLFPVLSFVILGLTIWILFRQPFSEQEGIIVFISNNFGSLQVGDAIKYLAEISLVLGFFNLLPLFPFDGGKIVLAVFNEYFPKLKYVYIILAFGFLFLISGWALALEARDLFVRLINP